MASKKHTLNLKGEDTFEQISNLNFTEEDKEQLNEAFQDDENVSDEEFFELAFQLAEANGLNC